MSTCDLLALLILYYVYIKLKNTNITYILS